MKKILLIMASMVLFLSCEIKEITLITEIDTENALNGTWVNGYDFLQFDNGVLVEGSTDPDKSELYNNIYYYIIEGDYIHTKNYIYARIINITSNSLTIHIYDLSEESIYYRRK